MMKVKKIILNGNCEKVQFEGWKCSKWLIKNFSENDVMASFDENCPENSSIKIPAGMGQTIINNEYLGNLEIDFFNEIYLSGTGEVEVQLICYKQI